MNKKHYLAPKAEFLMLFPVESVASNWLWGEYNSSAGASVKTITDVWPNSWQFDQNDESYKIN